MSDLKQFKEKKIEFIQAQLKCYFGLRQMAEENGLLKDLKDALNDIADQSYEQGKADMEKKIRQVMAEYAGIDEVRAEELINLLTTN